MRSCPVDSKKLVYDPLWGLIDITDFVSLIDIPQFQALGFKFQLGTTNFLFPSATHTRKQHSLGALKRTQDLCDRWLAMGFIDKEEARLIEVFALWHDLGHGPFSHVVEEVTKEVWGRDHDENGARIINDLQGVVADAGIDFAKLKTFFDHTNPLYLAVHDKNLGAEKMDYLCRDAFYTIGEKPRVEYLSEHTYFIDGEMMIHEKAIESAKAVQNFYVRMYKIVLHKNANIVQRLFQRMVSNLFDTEQFDEDEFWSLTDFSLLSKLENSKSPELQAQLKRFLKRDLPRTAVAFKIDKFATVSENPNKLQKVIGIDEEQMTALLDCPALGSPSSLRSIEEQLEKKFNLPKNSILVCPSNSMQRFTPKEIKIYNPGGLPHNLSDYFKGHFDAIEEEGKSYAVVRICTYPQFREKLSSEKVAKEIEQFMLDLVAKSTVPSPLIVA